MLGLRKPASGLPAPVRKPFIDKSLAPCFAQPALSLVWAHGSVNRPSCVSLRTSGSQRLPSHKQIQHKRLCLPPDSASRPASAYAPAGVLLRIFGAIMPPRFARRHLSPQAAGEPAPRLVSPPVYILLRFLSRCFATPSK